MPDKCHPLTIMTRAFLILFFLVASADLINIWFGLPYRQFTKSLIIPFLTLYFISVAPKVKSFYLFVIALVFAWLGDVFLLFSGTKFFLLGLASFLVMQFMYSFIFLRDREFKMRKVLSSLLILGLFSIGFNYYLWPYTSEIRIAVIIYSMAIAIMAFAGINRNPMLKGYSYIFIGVVLFVISDSVLALNNFAEGFWKGGFLVMLTYILAQYFIVEG